MKDFKTAAYTGMYFVNIIFEKASDDVENITVELSRDGLKINTYLCDETDRMLTIQSLAEGDYTYTVSQISGDSIFKATGEFTICIPKFTVFVESGRSFGTSFL